VHIAQLTSKLKLTIPKRMREYYGLRPGDKVVLWTKGQRQFVQP
jgi:AbrB family looped-hinge helix DNA binding protein